MDYVTVRSSISSSNSLLIILILFLCSTWLEGEGSEKVTVKRCSPVLHKFTSLCDDHDGAGNEARELYIGGYFVEKHWLCDANLPTKLHNTLFYLALFYQPIDLWLAFYITIAYVTEHSRRKDDAMRLIPSHKPHRYFYLIYF
jgi:hypothetical protein